MVVSESSRTLDSISAVLSKTIAPGEDGIQYDSNLMAFHLQYTARTAESATEQFGQAQVAMQLCRPSQAYGDLSCFYDQPGMARSSFTYRVQDFSV